ncbi:MAG: dTMP kinase [Ignavibacteria bacterium RBG_13_36_8]|nr:MAG: dTMP kinase [Ignavibacteria bacterium RBG_13_36_8]
MFITFEGLDFSGKSTQVRLLQQYLETIHKKVKVIREPGGTAISEKVRNILLDTKNSEMYLETELLLFSASRSQLVREIILPHLKKGYYVISDRFHDSSIAYQGFGRNIPLKFVIQLQMFVIEKAIPDITFFVDIPVEEVLQRMKKIKDRELDRIEVSKGAFYEKVRDGYLYLVEREKRYRRIDGMLSIEEIHLGIIKEIEKLEK